MILEKNQINVAYACYMISYFCSIYHGNSLVYHILLFFHILIYTTIVVYTHILKTGVLYNKTYTTFSSPVLSNQTHVIYPLLLNSCVHEQYYPHRSLSLSVNGLYMSSSYKTGSVPLFNKNSSTHL